MLIPIPETPTWLASKGRPQKAEKSLRIFKGLPKKGKCQAKLFTNKMENSMPSRLSLNRKFHEPRTPWRNRYFDFAKWIAACIPWRQYLRSNDETGSVSTHRHHGRVLCIPTIVGYLRSRCLRSQICHIGRRDDGSIFVRGLHWRHPSDRRRNSWFATRPIGPSQADDLLSHCNGRLHVWIGRLEHVSRRQLWLGSRRIDSDVRFQQYSRSADHPVRYECRDIPAEIQRIRIRHDDLCDVHHLLRLREIVSNDGHRFGQRACVPDLRHILVAQRCLRWIHTARDEGQVSVGNWKHVQIAKRISNRNYQDKDIDFGGLNQGRIVVHLPLAV